MTTRTLKPQAKSSTLDRIPKTHHEWDNLMRKVLARATAQGDRRLQGLQGVISKGESAKFLRKLGIICEADIHREFPSKKT